MSGEASPGMCRIVLCDDEAGYLALVKIVLTQQPDMEVVGEANDGKEVIGLCEELQPDVLLLDVAMPVMDGLAALPEVLRVSPGTSVIMLSGFESATTKDLAAARGAKAYLEKGISPMDLPVQVRLHCG